MPDFVKKTIDQLIENNNSFGIPPIKYCVKAEGGTIHYVYKIICTDKSSYYLKIRSDHPSGLPQYQLQSKDILIEEKALNFLSKLFPKLFPRVIFSNKKDPFIIIEDLLPEGGMRVDEILYLGLNEKELTQLAKKIGNLIGKIHQELKKKEELSFLDKNLSREKFLEKIKQKFRHSNARLFKIILDEYSKNDTQLILGDFSPKNIGVNINNEIIFFDVEDFCFGSTDFEISYFLGHAMLHFLVREENPTFFIEEFLKSYKRHVNTNYWLVKSTTIATMLHRINSPAPYKLQLTENKKSELLTKMNYLIENFEQNNFDWNEIVAILL